MAHEAVYQHLSLQPPGPLSFTVSIQGVIIHDVSSAYRTTVEVFVR